MPWAPLQRCRVPGCTERQDGPLCERHRREARRARSGRPWRRVRQQVLERDGYRCQVRLPGCTRVATMPDHRIAVADGGAPLDPANLRASCGHCNAVRSAGQRAHPTGGAGS